MVCCALGGKSATLVAPFRFSDSRTWTSVAFEVKMASFLPPSSTSSAKAPKACIGSNEGFGYPKSLLDHLISIFIVNIPTGPKNLLLVHVNDELATVCIIRVPFDNEINSLTRVENTNSLQRIGLNVGTPIDKHWLKSGSLKTNTKTSD